MLTKMRVRSGEKINLAQVIADEIPLRIPVSLGRTRLVILAHKAEEARNRLICDFEKMFSQIGCESRWDVPAIEINAEIGNMDTRQAQLFVSEHHKHCLNTIASSVEKNLFEACQAQHIGTIKWLGNNACRFTFYEKERRRTFTEIIEQNISHTHDIIDAKRHLLPASHVQKPRQAENIIRVMPKCLSKCCYVVTGTQIVSDIEQVGETCQPSELVNAARWMNAKARQATTVRQKTVKGVGRAARAFKGVIEEAWMFLMILHLFLTLTTNSYLLDGRTKP